MSQASSPYPGQSAYHPPQAQMLNSSLNPDTPPPPPPKPSSHETSRRGTPQQQQHQQVLQPGLQEGGYYGRDPYSPDSTHPSTYTSTTHGNEPAISGTQHQHQQPTLPEPPSVTEGWLPDIVKDKSLSDLQTILSTPSLISALSTCYHPASTTATTHLHSLLDTNKALAARLLDLETHLTELRQATESLLLTHQSLEVSWRKKQAEMDAALAPWSPKGLYQRLSAAIAEQEAVCRAVEESFLEGDHHHQQQEQQQYILSSGPQGKASEKEVADWVRRVRSEAAKLAARREMKARWDEGRVGGWR